MNYKSIFKSRTFRHKLLNFLKWIPDSVMLPIQYKIHTGRKLHLNNPKRYTEKLQHYKAYYRNPNLPRCVDKFEVRQYLSEKGFDKYLNKLYGVFVNVDEIDFGKLPNRFVVKTTSGGGNLEVFICHENNKVNQERIKESFANISHKIKGASLGREWAYNGIKKTRIIIEEYIENPENPDAGIDDYKFICMKGKVQCIVLDHNRNIDHHRNIYDRNWNNLNIETDHKCTKEQIPKPSNLDELIDVAERMAVPFPHVRVDLYNVSGKIIFGELTFYPWSGYVTFNPDSFDFELGENFDINY